jgi:phosphohistidine swiveling domain-containing protein
VDALCRQCHDQQVVEDFLHQLEIARRAQSVVEIHNHHIDQVGLGQLRRGVLAASEWLQSAGILSKADLIFWLTFSEIMAALRKPTQQPLADIIKTRQEKYQAWEQFEPPPFLGLPPALLPPFSTEGGDQIKNIPQNPGYISGIGASVGVVSGRARVIKSWQPAPQFNTGDILVTENAGPLWLPYFPILSGIVLEGGSLGQHAASTAREYGLPAVISALNATHKIEDGDWITVDGEKGIVILEEEHQ